MLQCLACISAPAAFPYCFVCCTHINPMSKNNFILLLLVLAKLLFQYTLIHPVYDLHRDEYLHLDQAQHLAWGYASVPPLTSWLSYIIAGLGNGVFWVKFFPALFGTLTMVLVWKTIEALQGDLFALLLGAVAVSLSAVLRINTLYQPNSFDILAWTGVYFAFIKYIRSQKTKWLYAAALVFALGFLNKYNMLFLAAGLLPALLLSPQRQLFAKKQLYYAAVIALLLVLPNIIWQYKNNFPVLHHLQELARTQLVNVNRSDFVKEQFLFFIGALFIIIAAFVGLFIYRPFKPYRFFVWAFAFTIAIFIYLKAKAYYAIGLYPVFIAFGSVYLSQWLRQGWRRWLQPVVFAIPVLLFIPFYRIGFPNKTPQTIQQHIQPYKTMGLLRWEDGKDHTLPQDFADMQGWKELAHIADSAFALLPSGEFTLVLCDNYGQAGAINYYTKNKNIQALSFNADYINWFNLQRPVVNMVVVKEPGEPINEEAKQLFESIEAAGSITNSFAREHGATVYILKHAKADVNKIIEREIKKRRAEL